MGALLLALAGALAALLDACLLHPGIESWDPVSVMSKAAVTLQGGRLPLRMDSGWLHLQLQAAAIGLAGSGPIALRLPNLACYGVESLLLWRLAKGFGGSVAAFGAVAVNSLAAATWLRLRLPLAYIATPAELLTAWWLLQGGGWWRGLALGALAVLGLSDYGAWPLALPLLAWAWWQRPRGARPPAAAIGLAAAAVGAAFRAGTHAYVGSYVMVRLGSVGASNHWVRGFVEGLWGYFSGLGRPDQLLESLPAFPLWALPLLAAGLLVAAARQRALLLWALLGLSLLALTGKVAEANRAILAWPALCVISGLGLAAWARRLPRRAALIALSLCLLGGAVAEAAAYTRMQDRCEALSRSYWRRLDAAAGVLKQRARTRPIQVLADLDWRAAPELAMLVGRSGPAATATAAAVRQAPAEAWALLTRESAPKPLDPSLGLWIPLADPDSPKALLYLLRLSPAQAPRFIARDHWLHAFRQAADPSVGGDSRRLLAALQAQLQDPALGDPWLRRTLLDQTVHTVLEAQQDPASCLPLLLAQPTLSSWQAAIAAQALAPRDPKRALALIDRSLRLEPDRPAAQELKTRLEALLKQPPATASH